MSIVYVPKELQLTEPLICAICHVKLLFSKATAGLFNADNQQAFACISHFSEVELLLIGWADFMASERTKYERGKREAETLGVGNAWLNS